MRDPSATGATTTVVRRTTRAVVLLRAGGRPVDGQQRAALDHAAGEGWTVTAVTYAPRDALGLLRDRRADVVLLAYGWHQSYADAARAAGGRLESADPSTGVVVDVDRLIPQMAGRGGQPATIARLLGLPVDRVRAVLVAARRSDRQPIPVG